MTVIADDADRENEGDLTIAAEIVTPEVINFMATYARGLICLAMTGERLERLSSWNWDQWCSTTRPTLAQRLPFRSMHKEGA
jgi:3,4-dihydroxy-2-butanone 4-phosphate synthase